MTIAWRGPKTILESDIDAADTACDVVSAAGIAGVYTPPFPVAMGTELVTVTAMGGVGNRHWTITRGADAVPHFARATVEVLRHRVTVAKAGGGTMDLSAIGEIVEHEYQVDGGEVQATVALTVPHPEQYTPAEDGELVLASNEADNATFVPYFSGTLGRPSLRRARGGAWEVTLTARGWMSSLGWPVYTRVTEGAPGGPGGAGWWPAYTTPNAIIKAVLLEKCPFISNNHANIVDGVFSITKPYNATRKKPVQIINELLAQGDNGDPVDWAVYTAPNGAHEMWVYVRTRWPQVHIPLAMLLELGLSWDTEEKRDKVVVVFAGGAGFAEAGSGQRVELVDLANSVDDYGTALQIARRIWAESKLLQLQTEQPLALEYRADAPATKYLTDDLNNEIALWRLRAGWRPVIDGLATALPAAWTNTWPLSSLQIKTVRVDHRAETTTVQLGRFTDYAKIIAQYAKLEAAKPASPLHQPGSASTAAAPPPNVSLPGSLSPSMSTLGGGGRIGYDQVAEDADVSEVVWTVETDAAAIMPGRKADLPIALRGQIIGFRTRGWADAQGPATAKCTIGHGTAEDYTSGPPVPPGTTRATLTMTNQNALDKNLSDDPNAAEHIFDVEPGDYLSFTIADDPPPTVKSWSIGVLYRRTEGTDRAKYTNAPTIQTATASRDGTTNVVQFTVVTNRICRIQIEIGLAAGDYRYLTAKTEVARRTSILNVPGLPTEPLHWRAHVWDIDENEAYSADQTL